MKDEPSLYTTPLFHRFKAIVRACGSHAQNRRIRAVYFSDCVAYQAEGRFYHNIDHIIDVLDVFEGVQHLFKRPAIAKYVLWKHDRDYNAHNSRDNETRSAINLVKDGIDLGIPYEDLLVGVGGTMATEHLGNKVRILTDDEKLIADIDLYGLSRSWSTVLHNSRNVRREFSHVSDDDFVKGHFDFFSNLEMRGFIYQSGHYKQYELAARENIMNIRQQILKSIVNARPTDKVFE